MRHGAFDISKVGINPDLYSISFATPQAPAGQVARTFTGLAEVDDFLRQAGISRDRITSALHDARTDGAASIPDIVIDDRDLTDLGLLTTSGTRARSA